MLRRILIHIGFCIDLDDVWYARPRPIWVGAGADGEAGE